MNKMLRPFLAILIGVCFYSCSDEINTKSYYLRSPFQLEEKIIFQGKNNTSETWIISRNKNDDSIKTKRLNSKNQVIDEITELITESGSEFISYSLIDRTEELESEIKLYTKDKDLIKWNLNIPCTYSGQYIRNGIIYKIKRTRKFYKEENGVLIFKDKYEFKPAEGQLNKNLEWLYNRNFTQTSYFEKNKGLTKYERVYLNGENETFVRKK